MTESIFTAAPGSVLVDVQAPAQTVTITTNPALTAARIRVTTDATDGETADNVRNARITQHGHKVSVRVAEPAPTVVGNMSFSGGGVHVVQNIGTIHAGQSFTGVTIDANGNMFVGGMTSGNVTSIGAQPTVSVVIELPPLCGVSINCRNAAITVTGGLAALEVDGHNTNLVADLIGRLKWEGHNGDVIVSRIAEWIDVSTHNGHTDISAYSGSAARVKTHNGGIRITAEASSTGSVKASTYNGSITLAGTRHLDVQTSTRRGRVIK